MITPEDSVEPLAPVLVVAGVRNEDSLGWAAASAWLDKDPNNEVYVTVHSQKAQDFLDTQREELGVERVSWSETDWNDAEQIARFQQNLTVAYGDERRIAGIVHSIARADVSNFSTPAHELDSSVYTDAFLTSALSLQRVVKAAKDNLRDGAGIVTFGFGEPGRFTPGYGGAMSVAKAALSQMVVELAASLGRADPSARTFEIVTGYIPTQSGKGVALAQRLRPRDVEARFAEAAVLGNANSDLQRHAAGQLAVSLIADEAYSQTTGQRIHTDAGWSLSSSKLL